jgi:hypothetical protein
MNTKRVASLLSAAVFAGALATSGYASAATTAAKTTTSSGKKLTHGSFRVSIAAIHSDLISQRNRWSWNTANCSGSIRFSATAPVVAGSGTGAYRGVTGGFAITVTIDEVDVKPVCNGTSGFLSQIILFDGTGTVSYR